MKNRQELTFIQRTALESQETYQDMGKAQQVLDLKCFHLTINIFKIQKEILTFQRLMNI